VAILDRAVVRLLPVVPKPVMRRISSRYIAGTELDDACRVVSELNTEGKLATVDVLGEEVTSADEAREISGAYLDVLAAIEREGLDSNVSIKPTAFGLKLDPELCRENVEAVVRDAAARSNFVRIDMEDASTTDPTLALYRELRGEGLDNVGIVLQASLRRTISDIRDLTPLRPNVRLCKGIYIEAEELQFQDADEVRRAFGQALDELLAAGCYVGIATHDEWVLAEGRGVAAAHGRTPDEYEFQMLLGVRPELGDRLIGAGNRLRIYVPFGRDWYEYSLRRLQENPKIAGYIAADTLGRLVPGRRNGRPVGT
jgi:proline dehydrogenase